MGRRIGSRGGLSLDTATHVSGLSVPVRQDGTVARELRLSMIWSRRQLEVYCRPTSLETSQTIERKGQRKNLVEKKETSFYAIALKECTIVPAHLAQRPISSVLQTCHQGHERIQCCLTTLPGARSAPRAPWRDAAERGSPTVGTGSWNRNLAQKG
jgi:hypothetical protein